MKKNIYSKGRLEVICGSMFSGKSEELIRRLKRAQIAQHKILVFKHSFDNQRIGSDHLQSHDGNTLHAIPLEHSSLITQFVSHETNIIGIDEVQFFDQDIINVVCALIEQKKRVIIAGLDLDFRGIPFGCIPTFMAIADSVTKLKAICIACGDDAYFTQRLVNGNPAKYDDPIILVGAQESYQARCRACHLIDKPACF